MYCNNPLCVTTQKYIHVYDDFFLFSRGSVSQNALGAKNGFHKFKLWSFFPHSSHISFDNKFLIHKEMDGSAKKNHNATRIQSVTSNIVQCLSFLGLSYLYSLPYSIWEDKWYI